MEKKDKKEEKKINFEENIKELEQIVNRTRKLFKTNDKYKFEKLLIF